MYKYLIYFFMIIIPTLALGDDISLTSAGEAKITDSDTVLARSQALDEAILKAVKSGVKNFLPGEPYQENISVLQEKIYSKASGYLDSLAITNISYSPGLVKTEITVALAKNTLENDLKNLGLLAFRESLPLVLAIVQEKNIDQVHWHFQSKEMNFAENVVENTMKLKGFRFVDKTELLAKLDSRIEKAFYAEDIPEMQKFASLFGANVIIVGKSLSRPVVVIGTPGDSSSAVATITLAAFRTLDGVEIASSSVSSTERGVDDAKAGENAITKAAREAVINMMPDIISKWAEKPNESIDVTMYVSGLKSIEDYIAFKNAFMNNIKGIDSFERRTITGNSAVYDLKITATVKDIVEQIQKKEIKGFNFEIRSFSDNSLDIRVKSKP
jgi:hypothetical protein